MIVVRMCPSRSIYLTSWNTDRTEGSYRKSTLLSTASTTRTDRLQRWRSTSIRRLVGNTFVAPVVYLKDSLLHRKSFHTLTQFTIEDSTWTIERFVVHTHRQNEMSKQQFRDILSPCHRLSCLQGGAYVFKMIGCWIIRSICDRHISIQET